jgi:hypothetical protein
MVTCAISPLAHTLALTFKIRRFCLDCFGQHKLLGFVDHFVFRIFRIFLLTKFNVSVLFKSPSLRHVQGLRLVHFTVLAPIHRYYLQIP